MADMYVQNISPRGRSMGANGQNGRQDHQEQQLVLFTDDSEESREAIRLLNSKGIAYVELNEKRDRADAGGRAPLLVTPVGPFIGVRSIAAVAQSNLAAFVHTTAQMTEEG